MNMEKVAPIPQGKYVPATRFGSLIFTAGMTPRKNGVLILSGKVTAEQPLESYRDAVCQATSNALIAAQNQLAPREKIKQVLFLNVYVNAAPNFQAHSKLADFATEYLGTELGDAGFAARAALGLGSLPGEAPVEIQMICAVE